MQNYIFPIPRKSRFEKTLYSTPNLHIIKIDSPSVYEEANLFRNEIQKFFKKKLEITASANIKENVLLDISCGHKNIKNQGYELFAKQGRPIYLKSKDKAGAFYGLQSLTQLLKFNNGKLNEFSVQDWPDFEHRGYMLDISRCKVPKMETLFKIVDILASLKLNQFQLYTEHTFKFKDHKTVWKDSSPITAEEILVLDSYCAKKHVQLAPNLNSFGHFERWLRHQKYKHLAECPDGFDYPPHFHFDHGSVLTPNQKSLRFLDNLYKEFLPNFSSSIFNVGCDETWELGQGKSQKECERLGVTKVYLNFLKKIHKLVKKYNKKMMFWGDIILHQPKLINEIPKDVIALEWGYDKGHPFDKHGRLFKKAGIPFYVCPGTSAWNSLIGRVPNCLANLFESAFYGKKHGAIGYLITDWGDGGHHQYLPVSYPGISAGAAYSWNLEKNKKSDIADAMNKLIFSDKSGLTGKLILEMGKIYNIASEKTRNCSILDNLLFYNPSDKKLLKSISSTQLKKCAAKLDTLQKKIKKCRPEVPDKKIILDEIYNGIDMAKFGLARGLAALSGKKDKKAMKRVLNKIIKSHKELWLARNRNGGLKESLSRLENLQKM